MEIPSDKDDKDDKNTEDPGLDFQQLDKEYDQLHDLLTQCNPAHVMLLLSTCLVQCAQSMGTDPGALLEAVCDVWNLTSAPDEVVTLQKRPLTELMPPDKGLH